jgi:hypothetical protein
VVWRELYSGDDGRCTIAGSFSCIRSHCIIVPAADTLDRDLKTHTICPKVCFLYREDVISPSQREKGCREPQTHFDI